LIVLIAVLIGAKLCGIVGARAAIPVAGAIQIIPRDVLWERQTRGAGTEAPPAAELFVAPGDG
jgi:predicted PurR-regulated permease PerM